MAERTQTLVVGSTGLLGAEIVKLLVAAGRSVRALARHRRGSNAPALDERNALEVVYADLKDPEGVRRACDGVSTVISTATATRSRREGDSIHSVDERGQLALVDAAERAGVHHFVFVSFPPNEVDSALQRAKRAVEDRIRSSRMSFTILQPVNFQDVWLTPQFGFDPLRGTVRIFGAGDRPVTWISVHDVARFAAQSAADNSLAGTVLPLGGPDSLTPLQVLAIFQELGSGPATVEYVPFSLLEERLAKAITPLEEAYAATMLTTARGRTTDPAPAVRLLPGRLTSVREYAARLIATKSKEIHQS